MADNFVGGPDGGLQAQVEGHWEDELLERVAQAEAERDQWKARAADEARRNLENGTAREKAEAEKVKLENMILELRSELTQAWTRHEAERARLEARMDFVEGLLDRFQERQLDEWDRATSTKPDEPLKYWEGYSDVCNR